MVYYAVIDTNVFISALLSKRADAATVRVLDAMFGGKIVPLYHGDILAEYDEVLHRSKFHFKEETIQLVHRPFNKYHIKQMQIQSLQYHPFCISSGKQLVPC